MKKLSYLMAAFLIAMTGCQKEPQQNEGLSSDDKVYMSFQIQTLTTRSATDTDPEEGGDNTNSDADAQFEVGLEKENTITSVNVVLKNDSKFVLAEVTTPDLTASQSEGQTWIATFPSSQLAVNEEYDVYIYANCPASNNVDQTSTEDIDEMTIANKFWMTNAYTAQKIKIEALSTDKTQPTSLGSHYVERAMARFDFMDASAKGDLTYELADGVSVTLTEAAVINMSNEFYMLRRATDPSDEVVVGYPEIANNWVVDTDWTAKETAVESNDYTAVANNFTYHLSTPNTWKWTDLSKLTQEDNWNPGADPDGATGIKPDPTHGYADYMVWCYVKENTLPNKDAQVNGLSTGVVFKGKIASTNTGIAADMTAKETIYAFGDKLYGSWERVLAAAENDVVLAAYAEMFGDNIEEGEADDLATAGFTAYKADSEGNYFTYYYYWNRHNDNSDNTNMGIMEFAVVRNNVYKLCVDYINKLGHPTPGDPDPDPVLPSDPDESGEYYFGVTVKVLPWVVRVNHIGF